jgi:septal ring factor EnvC (AmiA/AmiB activator)
VDWTLAAIVAAVSGVLGAVAKDAVPALLSYLGFRQRQKMEDAADERQTRKEQRESDRKEDNAQIKELKELIGVQKADMLDYRQQLHDLRGELQTANAKILVCEVDRARQAERIAAQAEWIQSMVAAMEEHGIAVRRPPPADSGTHTPLPPGAGRNRVAREQPKPEEAAGD